MARDIRIWCRIRDDSNEAGTVCLEWWSSGAPRSQKRARDLGIRRERGTEESEECAGPRRSSCPQSWILRLKVCTREWGQEGVRALRAES